MRRTQDFIQLDDRFCLNRFSKTQLHSLFKKREEIKLTIQKSKQEIGFLSLPYQENLTDLKATAQKIQKNSDTFLVIGIGGSSLGAKAALAALKTKSKPKVIFLENPNPDTTLEVLKKIRLKKTTINVITKSGKTIETLSLFYTLYHEMKKVMSEKECQERIIVTTEENKSDLYQLATAKKWKRFLIPKNVGGRYSVLTEVGLLPMAVAGIPIDEILLGAKTVADHSRETYLYGTYAFGVHHLLSRSMTVLFLYDERLKIFGEWFNQLWAESLAKSEQSCPTPLTAIGPQDQHSLLQLFLH